MLLAFMAWPVMAAPELHLLHQTPLLSTPSMVGWSEISPAGRPFRQSIADARTPLDQGLEVAWLPGSDDDNRPMFVVGALAERSRWPVGRDTPFTPLVVRPYVGLAVHSWLGDNERLDGYAVAGGGMEVATMVFRPWPIAMAPGLLGFGSLGVANRRGRVHARVELRAAISHRVDHFDGRAELAEEALVWEFWPGRAAISLVAGLGWRGRAARD
ncbi:MAG: hypothetical protein KTR31_05230 [Myxococcales bacterium]|nr:hypothetical protein [Myxococcales bacterium]